MKDSDDRSPFDGGAGTAGGSGRNWKRPATMALAVLGLVGTVGLVFRSCSGESGSVGQPREGASSNTGSSVADSRQRSPSSPFDLGKVLESRSVPLDGAVGASAVLSDGAALTIPAGAVQARAN